VGQGLRVHAEQGDVQWPIPPGDVPVNGHTTVLDAVKNYWDSSAKPKIKSITFKPVNDAEALIAGLRSGAINGTFDLPARDALTLTG
jgi:ABC-type transport system substrate-binding protein